MSQQEKRPANDQINREGARRYDDGVRANVPASDRQAREAARALDGPEGDALRKAEREGKAPAKRRP